MHRVEALIAGIRGCENGTVSAVIRGTSTPATYYTDFEGTSSATATSVALDQYGGKVMFFDRPVTLTAYSSGGSVVRQWAAGDDAGAVELKSTSFTGTAYSGGATAVGNPTTVEAACDKWITSAGAEDFKVLINGVKTNLSSAFSAVGGLKYYVVTDSAYGAVGDGVTNDMAAIQAAINAAHAAGGGVVFFPPGTYLVTGTLTSYADVAFLGYHRDLCAIRNSSTTTTLMSGAAPLGIAQLKFTFSSTPFSGTLLDFTAGASQSVVRDVLIGTHYALDAPISGTAFNFAGATTTEVRACKVFTTSAGKVIVAAGTLVVEDCEFASYASIAAYAGNHVVTGDFLRASNNYVTMAASGSSKVAFYAATDIVIGHGNTVICAGSGAVFVYDANTDYVLESGTILSGTGKLYGSGILLTGSTLTSRDGKYLTADADADPVVMDALQARTVRALVTTTAGWTGNCQVTVSQAPAGCAAVLSFWNDSGGAVTFEWGTNVSIAGGTTFAVANNSSRQFLLVSRTNNAGSLAWFLVSDTAGAEVVE